MEEKDRLHANNFVRLPIVTISGGDERQPPLRKSGLFENPDRRGQFKEDSEGNRTGIYFAVNYESPSGDIYQVREGEGGRATLHSPEGMELCELSPFWDIRDQEVVDAILRFCEIKVEDFVVLTVCRYFNYLENNAPGLEFVVEKMADIIKMNTLRRLREELQNYGLVEEMECQAAAIRASGEKAYLGGYDIKPSERALLLPVKDLPGEFQAQLTEMAQGFGEDFRILFTGVSSTAAVYEKNSGVTYAHYSKDEQIALARLCNHFSFHQPPERLK